MKSVSRASFGIFLWVLAAIFWTIGPAQAETRALLIGVSDYDQSFGLADLTGPPNDVRLLRDVLSQRGVQDIEILADGVEGAARPTRQAILDGFHRLAAVAGEGDFVIIHMSGHGTVQQDQNGDEADGTDEVFLPADVARAAPGSGVIPNALVDDEIGAAVDAIRAKGADVWLIMDSCHSGTGLRAASFGTRDRYVDPATLGVDVSAPPANAPSAGVLADPAGDDLPGKYVAFYAAQSSEVAREVDFPSSDGPPTSFGLFSAKLASRLGTAGAISYRQLFQAVLADMNDRSVPGGARMQTPFWEGPLIDATVLGGRDSIGVRQFGIDFDLLSAGIVQGLTKGTVLELVDDPTVAAGAGIGLAQIEEVEPLSSYVRPVADDCVADAAALCARAGELPEAARYARVVSVPVDFVLRLSPVTDIAARDARAGAGDDPLAAALREAADAYNARGGGRAELDASDYDVAVGRLGDTLWFGRAVALDGEPLGLSWAPGDGDLADLIARIAYAERFAAAMGAIAETASPLNPDPIDVKAEVQAADPAYLQPSGPPPRPRAECRNYAAPQPLAGAMSLKQCDELRVTGQGTVSGARDVNRIYIDSRFCLSAEYTRIEETARPANIGQPLTLCSDCPGYSAGLERLFVLVSEARPNAEPLNLSGVIGNCSTDAATRGGPASPRAAQFNSFLKTLDTGPVTRGSFGGLSTDQVWVEEMSWKVLPRAVALRQRVSAGDEKTGQGNASLQGN